MTTTIVSRVRDRAHELPDSVAMRHKRRGIWDEVTWAGYWDHILDVAHGLLSLGVTPGDKVTIHSENRPEWLYADLGVVAIRAVTAGIYPTNPADEVGYLVSHSGARVHIAEDQEQVDKLLDVNDSCPDVEWIIHIEDRGLTHYDDPRLLHWPDFIERGRRHRAAHPGRVEQLMSETTPDDVMTLVYTSGTTGPPKGAQLTVANVEFSVGLLIDHGALVSPAPSPRDLTLSYLPLCHAAERLLTTWTNAAAGTQVNFAESIATVPQNLVEVQPTVFFAVPRIWEKLLATATIKIESATWGKRVYARFWMRQASRIGDALVENGGSHTAASRVRYLVGWVFFFRALKTRLGLRRVRHALCGAAPVGSDVLRFFMGIGVPMHEVYGMTENTAIATVNRPGRVRLGTVGEAHEGIEVRIAPETGEILTRHPAVFAGYWRDAEATARTVDEDGWLHTGDCGEWVDGTHLRLTDRLKDIFITSGGKNVAPSEIENGLKASPFIKEAIAIGDGRNYITALIGIELDTVGAWAQARQVAFTTYRDLAEKKEVQDLVKGLVEEANTRFNAVEQVKKFRLLPRELDQDLGEVTATQKVKRSAIQAAFGDLVDSMYEGKAS